MESTHSTTRDPLKAVEDPDQRFMTAVAEWGKQNDHDVEKVLAHLRAKILDKKRVKEQNFINWISTYGQENSYDVADTVAVLRPEDVKSHYSYQPPRRSSGLGQSDEKLSQPKDVPQNKSRGQEFHSAKPRTREKAKPSEFREFHTDVPNEFSVFAAVDRADRIIGMEGGREPTSIKSLDQA